MAISTRHLEDSRNLRKQKHLWLLLTLLAAVWICLDTQYSTGSHAPFPLPRDPEPGASSFLKPLGGRTLKTILKKKRGKVILIIPLGYLVRSLPQRVSGPDQTLRKIPTPGSGIDPDIG